MSDKGDISPESMASGKNPESSDGLANPPEENPATANDSTDAENASWWYRHRRVIGAAAGAGAAVVAAPLVISAVGFGAGGIVAGSYAAQMMSAAAIANGGGVAAGSLVATLQSVGAAGFGLAGWLGVGAAGAAAGTGLVAGTEAVAGMVNGKTGEDGDPEEGGKENNEGKQGEDSKHPEEVHPDAIEIRIVHLDGSIHTFKMMKKDPIQKVFDKFFQKLGIEPGTLQFKFEDDILKGTETPLELRIDSGSRLVVYQP